MTAPAPLVAIVPGRDKFRACDPPFRPVHRLGFAIYITTEAGGRPRRGFCRTRLRAVTLVRRVLAPLFPSEVIEAALAPYLLPSDPSPGELTPHGKAVAA